MNPVRPDHFCVNKRNVLTKDFTFINYVNNEDLENLKKEMQKVQDKYGDDTDIFEQAIQSMRQELETNISMDTLLHPQSYSILLCFSPLCNSMQK